MGEICFRYSVPELVDAIADDLVRLAPDAAAPFRDATRSHVLHVPESLWLEPLVPELTLGLGGRLVECTSDTPEASDHRSSGDPDGAGEA